MFYRLMRFFLKFTARFYFKRFFVSGKENIPQNTPVIFASNHPNSFIDAVCIGIEVEPVTTLVRSDVFKSPVARYLLGLFNLMPIYRMQEGRSNLHKNDDVFDQVNSLLTQNKPILIFSEGVCVVEKRLRKLKKGTARLAFSSHFKDNKDIHVVPVGLNYTYPNNFQSEVILSFGKPIRVIDYVDLYEENQARAVNKITADLETSMTKEIIIINSVEAEQLTETLFKIARSEETKNWRWKQKSAQRLELEKGISEKVNHLEENHPEKFNNLSKMALQYEKLLQQYGISNLELANKSVKSNLITILFLLLGWPFYLIGSFINYIPLKYGKIVASKIKDPVFYTSIKVGVGYFSYLLIYTITIILTLFINNKWLWCFVIGIPLYSFMALYYRKVIVTFRRQFNYFQLTKNNKTLISDLLNLRNELTS